MIYLLLAVAVLIAVIVVLPLVIMKGPSLTQYDTGGTPLFYDGGVDVSSGNAALVAFLREHYAAPKGASQKEALAHIRNGYEFQGRTRDFKSEFKAGTAVIDGVEVSGEWTIPDNADPSVRILFVHGGAFMVGSPISHRPITDNLAQRTGCVVFSVDYRLGPENSRMDGIMDCQVAYEWLLDNGPNGPAPVRKMAVSGDSAGGSLTLMLLAWARDKGLRHVDAAVALSPTTDATGQGPSMRANMGNDVVLGAAMAPLVKMPLFLRLWALRKVGKINPSHTLSSPVFGDLQGLPPLLIQASTTEMLRDDALRYAEKARRAGSPVTLQLWRGQAHVWQHYDTMIPEAEPALDEIAKFLKHHGVEA